MHTGNEPRRHHWLWMLLAAAGICGSGPVQAQAFADRAAGSVDYSLSRILPGHPCADLDSYKGSEVVQVHAQEIAAAAGTPKFCRVTGVISPQVAFEVALPAHWNGRLYMIGNGSLAGQSIDDAARASERNVALRLGFAFVQTNAGHDSNKEPGGTFVLSNPQKAIDYAYRAVHVTVAAARDMIATYYAQPVQHAYWNSCSNGGRQGLLEAQRYPQDFDGIVANAPWLDQTGSVMGGIWNHQALTAAPLPVTKLPALAAAVMARCDAIDGIKDTVIDDPRKCDFDAHRDMPACRAGSDTPACLTSAQADTVMKIYRGPVSNGKALYPGYMPGSEALVAGRGDNGGTVSAWAGTIVPAEPNTKSADFNLAEGLVRYLALTPPQPDYDTLKFSFDRDPPLLNAWAAKANATSTDLDAFSRHGGKLLITYGWADQVLQPLAGVQYYEQLQSRYGNFTVDFARLFMVPGMNHCSGGNGVDTFDAVTAIINWVESGKAPDVLPASRLVDGQVVRTRLLCPYPKVAHFLGIGKTDNAANFRCAAP